MRFYYVAISPNIKNIAEIREASFGAMSGHVRVLKKCPFCPVAGGRTFMVFFDKL